MADFSNQVRLLLAFLELPWNDALLEPQAHAQRKGFISTPSYSQVIEPISNKSVGRWRRHEAHFAGVLPLLDRWGYDAGGAVSSNNR